MSELYETNRKLNRATGYLYRAIKLLVMVTDDLDSNRSAGQDNDITNNIQGDVDDFLREYNSKVDNDE